MTLAEQWLNEGEARGMAKGKAVGIVEGIAKGKVEAILALLSARGLTVSEFQRARILNEKDSSRLEHLLIRAVHAQSVSELFED